MSRIHAFALRTVVIAFSIAVLAATPAVLAKTKDYPEVDQDGLHLVKGSDSSVVYAKPGASLSGYDTVLLVDCMVQFRENWERDYNLGTVGLEGRVTNRDVERIKTGLAEEFKEEFTKVLTDDGYTVVDAVGDNVLVVRPAIINLDVSAPDMKRSGPGNTWVRSAGSMTLYMELYDAASNELLGRVIDAQADRDDMRKIANEVTNRAAAKSIIRDWAERLSQHLAKVSQ